MNTKLYDLQRQLAAARRKLAEDRASLAEVRDLLDKADERRIKEPAEARKWAKVLANLEASLDLTRARCAYSEASVGQLEAACAALELALAQHAAGIPESPALPAPPHAAEALAQTAALNLEEACQLQCQIDAGEIQDADLVAGLALANQLRPDAESGEAQEVRRQVVLRAAVEKVRKQTFDTMTLDEIRLLMACHSLLTSRLEPSMRDQRLRRILDGAIKILQKKKDVLEGRGSTPAK